MQFLLRNPLLAFSKGSVHCKSAWVRLRWVRLGQLHFLLWQIPRTSEEWWAGKSCRQRFWPPVFNPSTLESAGKTVKFRKLMYSLLWASTLSYAPMQKQKQFNQKKKKSLGALIFPNCPQPQPQSFLFWFFLFVLFCFIALSFLNREVESVRQE